MLLTDTTILVKMNVIINGINCTSITVVKAPYWVKENNDFDDIAIKCCKNIACARARAESKRRNEIVFSSETIYYSCKLGWNAKF